MQFREENSLRKSVKIILAAFAVIFIVGFACFSLVIFDVPGSLATGTHPLPNEAAIGKAIVVYDPGLTGGAKDIATKIGYDLQDAGYDVLLAGVKSSSASDLSGYDVVVVGGPNLRWQTRKHHTSVPRQFHSTSRRKSRSIWLRQRKNGQYKSSRSPTRRRPLTLKQHGNV